MQGSLISLLFFAAVSVAASHAGNMTPLRRFSVATGNSAHRQAFAGSRSQSFASDLGVRAGENLGASGATENGGEEQNGGANGVGAPTPNPGSSAGPAVFRRGSSLHNERPVRRPPRVL